MSRGSWMRSNLTTQVYGPSDAERRELSLDLRFSTGLSLTLVVTNLCIPSEALAWWERRTARKAATVV
jgi:hypothetical protein